MTVNFSDVKIGQYFWSDGCSWIKKTENKAEPDFARGLAQFAPDEEVTLED